MSRVGSRDLSRKRRNPLSRALRVRSSFPPPPPSSFLRRTSFVPLMIGVALARICFFFLFVMLARRRLSVIRARNTIMRINLGRTPETGSLGRYDNEVSFVCVRTLGFDTVLTPVYRYSLQSAIVSAISDAADGPAREFASE